MWLIFTDEKKWVIELTKEGTLWYNHYFFNDCFKYMSLGVVENQHYITEWVESIIQNGVINTNPESFDKAVEVESIIQNGVKETKKIEHDRTTYHGYFNQERGSHTPLDTVQDVIENGIKKTNWRTVDNFPEFEERVIQNGIKETWGYERQPQTRVNNVIQTGKKFDTQ